jgi:Uma2 family endonuclease
MQQPLVQSKRYTYSDYVQWDDDVRRELIDGVAYDLAAPTLQHQDISEALYLQLATYLQGKTCKVFSAPLDVRLNADTTDDTVVQPDFLVVCDPKKLGKKACLGAPDLVIEIESPNTRRKDHWIKFNKYLSAGVREYWEVDPDSETVDVHILQERSYITHVYNRAATVPVSILEDCAIDLSLVFPEQPQ